MTALTDKTIGVVATRRVPVANREAFVPDATRKRVVEVHTLADEVRIFEDRGFAEWGEV